MQRIADTLRVWTIVLRRKEMAPKNIRGQMGSAIRGMALILSAAKWGETFAARDKWLGFLRTERLDLRQSAPAEALVERHCEVFGTWPT